HEVSFHADVFYRGRARRYLPDPPQGFSRKGQAVGGSRSTGAQTIYRYAANAVFVAHDGIWKNVSDSKTHPPATSHLEQNHGELATDQRSDGSNDSDLDQGNAPE